MKKEEKRVPFFWISEIIDGAIEIEDKDGMHRCIVNYIEDFMQKEGKVDSNIVCYLVESDSIEVDILIEDLEDVEDDLKDWHALDLDDDEEEEWLFEWEDSDYEFTEEMKDELLKGDIRGFIERVYNDAKISKEEKNKILFGMGVQLYEIMITNDDYIDPLNKALEYFESIEDYENCTRVNRIKTMAMEWLLKKEK